MDREVVLGLLRVIANSKWVFLFLSVVMLDIVVGTVKGFILGESSSSIGIRGLLKHSLVIITTLVVVFYLLLFDLEVMGRTWLLFFIVQYITSLIESWGELGLPLPEFIIERVERLRVKTDKGEDINV